ncbi:MAG: ankyrin repeat domain-containing protein [Cytophagales bacterium]|nr:ankyrin repeat domain-containing protein [Cytophagales bacterium]
MKRLKLLLLLVLAVRCTKKKIEACYAAKCLEVSTRDEGWYIINASKNGDVENVRRAISKGVNVNETKDGYGKTALHWAAENGHRKVVELLLGNGAQVEVTDKASQTPLHLAVEKGHNEVVSLLLDRDAGMNAKNNHSQTSLHLVVEKKEEEMVKMIVEKGREEELTKAIHPDTLHFSPLYIAVQHGDFELVKLLIYGRAMKNNRMVGNGKDSIEHEAVRDRGTAVEDLKNQGGKTLLHVAVENGHLQIVKLLVEFMATAAEIDEKKEKYHIMKEVDYVNTKANDATAADLAKRRGHSDIVNYLKKIKKPWFPGLRARVRSLRGCNFGIGLCSGQGSGGCTWDTPTFDESKAKVIYNYRKKWRREEERM